MTIDMIADSDNGLRVSLDVFDGPLDLLLNLVKERQLDIATVPLALVADQYLAYIQAMESLDVELAADYLVVASTLVFLKSKALLPPIPIELAGDPEESAEAIEARLRDRLIAYSKYRDAGQELKGRAAEAAAYFLRPDGGDATADFVQRYRIDAAKLAGALAAALRAAKPEKRTIVRERVSLNEQMDVVSPGRAPRRARLVLRPVRRARPRRDHRDFPRRPRARPPRAHPRRAGRRVRGHRAPPRPARRPCSLNSSTPASCSATSKRCCSSPPKRSRSSSSRS